MSIEGYLGDFPDNATFSWVVPLFASGVLTAPVGLTLEAYKDASATQTATGVTVVSTSFDGIAGLVLVSINCSDAFYTLGSEFHVMATAGTLEGVSLIGRVFFDFSIERTGATLALIKAGTFAVNVTQWLGSAAPPLVGARLDVSVGAMAAGVVTSTAIAANAIGATQLATDAIQAAKIQAAALTSAKFAAGAFDAVWTVTVRTLSAAGVQAIWDALTSSLTVVGSIGKRISDFLTGDAFVRIGANGAGLTAVPWNTAWDAEVQSEVDDALVLHNLDHLAGNSTAIPAVVAGTYLDQLMDDGTATYDRTTDSLQAARDEQLAIKAKTDNLPVAPAAVGSTMTLTSGERDAIASALLDLANGVETSVTVRKALRGMAAVLCGDVSGAASSTELFKAIGNAGTTRVTVPVDGTGNRTGVSVS